MKILQPRKNKRILLSINNFKLFRHPITMIGLEKVKIIIRHPEQELPEIKEVDRELQQEWIERQRFLEDQI